MGSSVARNTADRAKKYCIALLAQIHRSIRDRHAFSLDRGDAHEGVWGIECMSIMNGYRLQYAYCLFSDFWTDTISRQYGNSICSQCFFPHSCSINKKNIP